MGALVCSAQKGITREPTMRTVLAFAALALVASGLPTEDAHIPEVPPAEEQPEAFDAHAEAVRTISLLQSKDGKDDNACRDMAETSKKDVAASVKAQQKILNGLDDGSKCPETGMKALRVARKAKTDAEKTYEKAKVAYKNARSAEVDFGSYAFSSLSEGHCSEFFDDPAYLKAKNAVAAAHKKQQKAEGEAKAAAKALKAAEAAQKRAVLKCQCGAKDAMAKAWKAANANNDGDAKTYLKAENMLCVVDGKTGDACETGKVPKVSEPQLVHAVASADCASLEAPAPAPALQDSDSCLQAAAAAPSYTCPGMFEQLVNEEAEGQASTDLSPKKKKDYDVYFEKQAMGTCKRTCNGSLQGKTVSDCCPLSCARVKDGTIWR